MQILTELIEFLWSVVNSWAGYATGGLIVAFVWFYFGFKQSSPPRNLILVLAVFFLFCAFFNAWRIQKSQVVTFQARSAKPELGGQLVNFYTFTKVQNPDLWLVVGGTITNPQGPPTATLNWSLEIEFNDGAVVKGTTPMNSGKDVSVGPITLPVSRYWPYQTATPIPPGGLAEGWYWAVFPGITTQALIERKAVAVVRFDDAVSNSTHVMRVDASRAGLTMPPVL